MLRLVLLLMLCSPGLLLAATAPAEPPPEGFAGRQYVDSTGCVFQRNGAGWTARLYDTGDPVCGYPPTPRAWGARPAALPHLTPDPALAMPGLGAAEARLLAAVTGQMRPGDFVPQPLAEGRADGGVSAPQPVAGQDNSAATAAMPADVQLTAALRLAPAIAVAGAGAMRPDSRLCALLGAAPVNAGAAAPGRDPTGGYCSSPLTSLPEPILRAAETVPAGRRSASAASAVHPAAARPVVQVASTAPKPTPVRRLTRAVRKERQTEGRAVSTANMIPANARWLEVGRFSDPAAADRALRRLSDAGFPVGRGGKGAAAVLAGPYASRQAIVTAWDKLTRAGYRQLVPR